MLWSGADGGGDSSGADGGGLGLHGQSVGASDKACNVTASIVAARAEQNHRGDEHYEDERCAVWKRTVPRRAAAAQSRAPLCLPSRRLIWMQDTVTVAGAESSVMLDWLEGNG